MGDRMQETPEGVSCRRAGGQWPSGRGGGPLHGGVGDSWGFWAPGSSPRRGFFFPRRGLLPETQNTSAIVCACVRSAVLPVRSVCSRFRLSVCSVYPVYPVYVSATTSQ